MIHKFQILKGHRGLFTNKLYKGREFHFSDGLNIITGRNGSGKTVLLNFMALMTGNTDNSVSPHFIEPIRASKGLFEKGYYTIPELIQKKIEDLDYPPLKIEWDGAIVNKVNNSNFDKGNRFDKLMKGSVAQQMYNKSGELGGVISQFLSTNSAGEKLIGNILSLMNLPRDYHGRLDKRSVNDAWLKCDELFYEWHSSFENKGKPTILIDEFDKHLDLDNQQAYFEFLKEMAKTWQIIVVSHSIFAFKQKNVNYINLNPKYFKTVSKIAL